MNRQEFFEKIGYLTADEIMKVSWAYAVAKRFHDEQKYGNGRYFEHLKRVALNCIEHDLKSVDDIIIALLHDVIEDCFIPEGLFEKLFGEFVADAVEILSKKTPVYDSANGRVTDKKRKSDDDYFGGIASANKRIRMIKLADRLDNVRHLEDFEKERRQEYIIETEKYVLPIAKGTDETFYKEIKAECEKY